MTEADFNSMTAARAKKAMSHDQVNSPDHYKLSGGLELITVFKLIAGDNFKWYPILNIIKYIVRYPQKNGMQDLYKAKRYLEILIEWEEGRSHGQG